MNNEAETIVARIRALQDQLHDEFERRSSSFHYRLENGRVVFEEEARRRHREFRIGLIDFLSRTRPSVVLVAPVIYSLIIPFVLLDIFVTIFQRVCFPVYGIQRVRRSDFICIDRHHLAYLNALQKFNCVYCGYCNGLIGYIEEIAGRTEAYWCPIKHAARVGSQHAYYAQFVDYGDGEAFHGGLISNRNRITLKHC